MACQSTASPAVTFAASCIGLFLPVAVPLQRLLGRSPGARQHPFELRHRALSGGLWFPRAFRRPAFASCAFLRPLWVKPALAIGLLERPDHNGVTTFHIGKTRRGSWPLYAGSWAPSQPGR